MQGSKGRGGCERAEQPNALRICIPIDHQLTDDAGAGPTICSTKDDLEGLEGQGNARRLQNKCFTTRLSNNVSDELRVLTTNYYYHSST